MMEFAWAAHLLPLAGAGFAVGLLVGLTGVGGGSLMTPLLISSFGVAPQVAVGTDLLYAAVTKTAGGWHHHISERVEWPVVLRLAAGSIPASLLVLAVMAGLHLNTAELAHWIRMGLVVALPISGLSLLLYPVLKRVPMRELDIEPAPRTLATVAFGAALGILVTLTSVGAGAIGVSVLAALYPLLPAKRIVGSDVAHAVPLTFVGGLGHFGLGHVDFGLLGALLAGSIPGILLGSKLSGAAPEWLLRPLLAVMLFYAAWVLFNK